MSKWRRAKWRSSPSASSPAWVSSSTSGPRDAAKARGVRGARAQPRHHQLDSHVRLPADPPAGRVRASRQAPAQEEGANARVRARATATAVAATVAATAAPSGRARCRRCRAVIAKGKTRLEVCASVRPGRHAATRLGHTPRAPATERCAVRGGSGGGQRPSWRGTEGSRPRGWPDEIIGGRVVIIVLFRNSEIQNFTGCSEEFSM